MNFRSLASLNLDIQRNLHKLPKDIDVVVGIPRSGLMAASLVALALNLPLADIDGFLEGRLLGSGKTRRRDALDLGFDDLRNVLVIDDSTRTGEAMIEARRKLAGQLLEKNFTFCAIYGVPNPIESVDLTLETVPEPRVFEWNVMHHPILQYACVDIDGVLCHDPNDIENDDGAGYLEFLANARPLHRPTAGIGTLVTSRLEKYRAETEAWLKQHDIRYERLVMLDLPDAESRRRLQVHGSFKGTHYRKSSARLFIESEAGQARRIAEISGKPVLCIEGAQMFHPNGLSPIAVAQRLRHSTRLKHMARSLMGDMLYTRVKTALTSSG